jgi:hypothetical protein
MAGRYSPTDVWPVVREGGAACGDTDLSLSLAAANTDLNGNALQEQRFLARGLRERHSPTTRRTARCCEPGAESGLSQQWSLSGNVYYRRIKTATTSADINDDSLDQNVYQPNAAEQAALTAAGYSGFPTAGENAGNTPFPKWRCIANALLQAEPAELCNGVLNQTNTDQSQYGLSAQFNFDGKLQGLNSQSFVRGAIDASRSHFTQGSQLGYLNPDRSLTGLDATATASVAPIAASPMTRASTCQAARRSEPDGSSV